jgi:hypothetical protein
MSMFLALACRAMIWVGAGQCTDARAGAVLSWAGCQCSARHCGSSCRCGLVLYSIACAECPCAMSGALLVSFVCGVLGREGGGYGASPWCLLIGWCVSAVTQSCEHTGLGAWLCKRGLKWCMRGSVAPLQHTMEPECGSIVTAAIVTSGCSSTHRMVSHMKSVVKGNSLKARTQLCIRVAASSKCWLAPCQTTVAPQTRLHVSSIWFCKTC